MHLRYVAVAATELVLCNVRIHTLGLVASHMLSNSSQVRFFLCTNFILKVRSSRAIHTAFEYMSHSLRQDDTLSIPRQRVDVCKAYDRFADLISSRWPLCVAVSLS